MCSIEGVQLALARTASFAINRQQLGCLGETGATKMALVRIIATLLAILHAALGITAAMEKSPTFVAGAEIGGLIDSTSTGLFP